MGRITPRFDDKVDDRLREKTKAGLDLSDISKDARVANYLWYSENRRELREKHKQGAEITNKKRQDKLEKDREQWQAYADNIAMDPTLKKGEIYRRTARKFDKSERTIRRNIKLS